eukprot:19659-Heterococcus_DN1.PRE.1
MSDTSFEAAVVSVPTRSGKVSYVIWAFLRELSTLMRRALCSKRLLAEAFCAWLLMQPCSLFCLQCTCDTHELPHHLPPVRCALLCTVLRAERSQQQQCTVSSLGQLPDKHCDLTIAPIYG